MKRVTIAFLLAPFPVALIQSVLVMVWPKKGAGVFEHPQSMFLLMCLLFYAVEIVVALPLYLLKRKRLPQRLLPYGFAGAPIALLPFMLSYTFARGVRESLSSYAIAYNVALFVIGGFLAGAVFWRVTKPLQQTLALNRTFS